MEGLPCNCPAETLRVKGSVSVTRWGPRHGPGLSQDTSVRICPLTEDSARRWPEDCLNDS